jgi:hypothetical protein
MSAPYPIRDVTHWPTAGDEAMGSKPKVWLAADDGVRWLFKERHRPHTGDDWAEKVAAEVADALGIPHATIELAHRSGKRGIVPRDLVWEMGGQELVLGNSLLVEADPAYPTANRFHVAEHTLDRVHAILTQPFIGLPASCSASPAVQSASDLFTGYLMLDALLGNTDRHHENWAILQMSPQDSARVAVLCPSFDHASCLGHNLQDKERSERLTTRDVNRQIAAYVRSPKVRSALYRSQADGKPLSPLGAFRAMAERCPGAAGFWMDRLSETPVEKLTDLVAGVPGEIMSDVCRRFVCEMLAENRRNLVNGAQ